MKHAGPHADLLWDQVKETAAREWDEAVEIYWNRCQEDIEGSKAYAISLIRAGGMPVAYAGYLVNHGTKGAFKAAGWITLLGTSTGVVAGCSYNVARDSDHSWVWER